MYVCVFVYLSMWRTDYEVNLIGVESTGLDSVWPSLTQSVHPSLPLSLPPSLTHSLTHLLTHSLLPFLHHILPLPIPFCTLQYV